MTVKASDGSDKTSTVTSFSFYNPFITTLRVAAEVNIPILINLSNCNIVVLDFLLHLISIVNYTNINHGQFNPNFGFLVKNVYAYIAIG